MPIELDHLILSVNDQARSAEFYGTILGLEAEPKDGPFLPLRVTPGLTILLNPGGGDGGEHLAFALTTNLARAEWARPSTSSTPIAI